MTARRLARAQQGMVMTAAPPRSLLIGPCAEVWAAEGAGSRDPEEPLTYGRRGIHVSAHSRFSLARRGWLRQAGVTSEAEACALVPNRAPWSAADSPNRLTEQALTIADLGWLREEATELVAANPRNLHYRPASVAVGMTERNAR